ncbi:MAG: transcriptional repressor LexA [Opitutaceae bacterium]
MNDSLPPGQLAVLRFLEARAVAGESTPTLREICKEFDYRSTKAAFDHIVALEEKGYVLRTRGARGIQLVNRPRGVPLLGHITAGSPRDTEIGVAESYLSVDPASFGIRNTTKAFALRVEGNSMIGRNLVDGDIVVLEHGANPKDQDIVAALIDNETTLKTLVLRDGKAWLRAENPRHPNPEATMGLEVQGVARGLIRLL